MTRLTFGNRRLGHHWLVVGITQSGKTTLVRSLLEDTPRVVNLDLPPEDYTDLGDPCFTFSEAAAYLDGHLRAERFHLVLNSGDPAHHVGLVRYLWEAWTALDLPPVLLVLDEARRLSNLPDGPRKTMPEPLRRIYAEGLKLGLACCTITQHPQQVDTDARNLSDYKISCRYSGTYTSDLRAAFGGREDELQELATLTPGTRPEKGVHFLTYPPRMDLRAWWRKEIVNPMT